MFFLIKLLNDNKTTGIVKFETIPMQELSKLINVKMKEKNFIVKLLNQTDDFLQSSIKSNFFHNTMMTLERDRHRPFEIIVSVDHKLLNQSDLVKIRINQKISNSSQSSYRWLWLLLIFGGILISFLSSIIEYFHNIIIKLTPNMNNNQRSVLVGLILISMIVVWLFIIPKFRKIFNKLLCNYDRLIYLKIIDILEIIKKENIDVTIRRCWSCFKEISITDNFCKFCNEIQN